jgi:DNA polymerase elongation subunit (family B)
MKGWILDVDADLEHNCIVIWIKGENGSVERYETCFYPSFYLYASPANLVALEPVLADNPGVHSLEYEEKSLWLGEPVKKVLRVSFKEYGMLMELARELDELGEFSRYELFNVDLSIPFAYQQAKEVVPMALIETKNDKNSLELELLEDRDGIDYTIPALRSMELGAELEAEGIPTPDAHISKIILDDTILEGSDEAELLLQLRAEMRTFDPDLVYTENGDSFLLPYLHYRAKVNELDDFYLGRDRDLMQAGTGKGRSYFSYGRIIYKPPRYLLNGRVHIDRSHSFIYREGGIHGLIELSRLSSIPLQTLSRVTPGTVITAMQIAQALRENVLVRWKKNVPEDFKDAKTLFLADRGGMIYEPTLGIHENVVEIDFTSLYPAIMVKHNVSPETVLCNCCKNSNQRAPIIDYHICEKRIGLIPRVLEPIITRRAEYKKRLKDNGYHDLHPIYEARKNALKWILVTCFGYTGYRNARFGRIECHEVINAYGRELLLTTARIAEELGYKVLHGIVDSLWLKSRTNDATAHETLRDRIYEETGIALEVEGIYKWIVFLPRRTDRTGALNRYYGLFENGTMKIRGLELRRSDSPQLIKNAQMDMLRVMATANDIVELHEVIPEVIEVLKEYADMVMSGACDLKDLVFTSVVSKDLEDYTQLTNNVACLLQLKERGLRVRPGEHITYVITDAGSKRYDRKVKAWQLAQGDERYDKRRYVTHLVRAGGSILSPFGYTEHKLADILRTTHQLTLAR